MNANELSLRLQTVAKLVEPAARVADIGSDHAYLPVALVREGKIHFAVAGEVVKGPFEAAKRQVAKYGLEEQIAVRFGDGLEVIEATDQITTVTICGMGGVLIRDILQRGLTKLTGQEKLILQPNIAERQLRQWLVAQGYTLTAEKIVREHHKTYEVIVAEKDHPQPIYSERELYFGPQLLAERDPIFIKKWQHQLKKQQQILASLEKSEHEVTAKKARLKQEIAWIEEVIASAGN